MVLAVINLISEEKPMDSRKHISPPPEVCYFANLHKKVQTAHGSLVATIKLNRSRAFPTSHPKTLRFSWTNSGTRTEFSPFLYHRE